MNYDEAIEYLMSLADMERGRQASRDPVMSLDSIRSLLDRLDRPQHGRGTVHITGSKGKGTTAAMIEGILRTAGESTALYTSPHLHSYTERIRFGEDPVSPGEFATGLEAILPAIQAERESETGEVSTFGVLTALFFWLVRAQAIPVRWQVVEVGLGGSFDATNVFDTVDAAVITPISLEHTAILGSTVAEIARDKAGIIRPGCVCILAPQQDDVVREIVAERCNEVGAELVDVAATYETEIVERHVFGQSFNVTGPSGTWELRTPMLGAHQVENAATTVATADALAARGAAIDEDAISTGIARIRVPGRMEVMGRSPLVVADGAHNGASARALATALRDYLDWERCFVVLGATRDKDVAAIGSELASIAEMFVCTPIDNPRSMDTAEMLKRLGTLGPPAVAEPSLPAAMDTALGRATPRDLVCVTGSLYLVAEARTHVLGESVTS